MFARLPLTDSRWHSHLGSHGRSYSECITVHAVTLTNACVQQDFVSSVQVRRSREHHSLAPCGTRGAAVVCVPELLGPQEAFLLQSLVLCGKLGVHGAFTRYQKVEMFGLLPG